MEALAAAALGLHWSDITRMLYEVMLWLHYGYIMVLLWLLLRLLCNWNYHRMVWEHVRSLNQGKLKVVKQEMARVNVDIWGISKLKWTGMGEFNSDVHYIYYWGQESLRRNGVAIVVNKRVRNAVLGRNLKNGSMQHSLTYITAGSSMTHLPEYWK